jgi:hypothetical protein
MPMNLSFVKVHINVEKKWAHIQYGGRGGEPNLDLDFNLGGFFCDSFLIFGQHLRTYHHVMSNVSSDAHN